MNGRQSFLVSSLIPTLLICLFLAGCERRELTYYKGSEITIYADWSRSGLDEEEQLYGATLLFYPQEGGEPKKVLMGTRSYGTVRLPVGIYNVLIFNRSFYDFSHIAFRGNERYDLLEAYANQIETRMDESTRTQTRVIVNSPDGLAVDVVEGFEVTEDMLGNYNDAADGRTTPSGLSDRFTLRLSPRKLTREMIATFHVEGLNNIRSVTCRLDGVAESVFLSTGKLSEHTVTQEFHPATLEYSPGSPFDGMLTGKFDVFGFDSSLPHHLRLEALLADGKTTYTEDFDHVTVTEKDNGEGVIILHIEVTTKKIPDVKPEGGSDSGFDADVDGWGDDVNTDVPI